MDENLHDIDDLFRKAINGHEDTPSQGVWESIDNSLDKQKVISISQKYRQLKWAAAAMFIFCAGMAMYTWNTKLKNKELVRQSRMNTKKIAADNSLKTKGSAVSADADIAVTNGTFKAKQIDTSVTKNIKAIASASDNAGSAVLPDLMSKKDTTGSAKNKETIVTRQGEMSSKNADEPKQKDKNYSPVVKENSVAANNKKKEDLLQARTSLEKETFDVDLSTVPGLKNSSTEPQEAAPLSEKSLQKNTTGLFNEASNNSMPALAKKRSVNKINNPLSATIFYSKDFVSSRIDNDNRGFREDDKNEIKNKEKIKNSFTTGLLLNYKTGKNWGIETGLTFSTLMTDIQPKTIFARPDNRGNISFKYNCSAGYSFVTLKSVATPASGDSITALSSTNKLNYIGVPFALNYTFSHKKVAFTPAFGVAGNFLTKGKIETVIKGRPGNDDQKENINHIEGLNSFYLNAMLKFSLSYSLNKYISVSFTPVSQFALTSINKDAPVKTYLNSFGLAAGLSIKL